MNIKKTTCYRRLRANLSHIVVVGDDIDSSIKTYQSIYNAEDLYGTALITQIDRDIAEYERLMMENILLGDSR